MTRITSKINDRLARWYRRRSSSCRRYPCRYDMLTGEVSQKEVTAVFERTIDHINYLTIEDEYGNEQVIEVTDGHPFWVVTDEPDLERAARGTVDENGVILYHENIDPGLNGLQITIIYFPSRVPTNNNIIMDKQFLKVFAIVAIIYFAVGFLFIRPRWQRASIEASRLQCHSQMLGLYFCIQNNMYEEGKPPLYDSCDGTEEYWSWRTRYFKRSSFTSVDMGLFEQFNFDEPWNSEHNLPLVEKIQTNRLESYHFYCPSDRGSCNDSLDVSRSSYVAVIGSGTIWSALREGVLSKDAPCFYEFGDMILFIETSEPKNHWAEPGDDVSPEEVIRLFEADPGLVKNSGKPFPSRYSHWPKHFVRLNGTVGRFDEFPDVDTLRKALVIEFSSKESSQPEVE